MKIKDQTFNADQVDLDGNIFEKCKFIKSRLVFCGRSPVGFVSCVFEDVAWDFRDAAALTASFVKLLSENTGDYGKGLLVNSFPALRDWIKPDILARISQPYVTGPTNE